MFEGITSFVPTDGENIIDPTILAPTDQPLAPLKYGASRIPIIQDPNRPEITILERHNGTNSNDYVIYISNCIRSEGGYYSELITLLRTLSAASKVTIYISSPGGSLHVGAMIASAIQVSKANITTTAIGIVASAAALIWSYGHIRTVADGAVLMFHMSSHGDWNSSMEIKITAENTVRYVKEVAIDPLVAQGILTIEEAETIIDKRHNFWIDSVTLNRRLEAIHHG
jgi:ATP-dependent protease ClpP protease subunit